MNEDIIDTVTRQGFDSPHVHQSKEVIRTMQTIDKLRMDRRNIEVKIKQLEDKAHNLKEEKRAIDNRIVALQQSDREISDFGKVNF